MKIPIPQFLILVLIVWFGSLQNTQAVNPPPDGGYDRGNTAEGDDALFKLTTTGAANTAIGAHALFFNTTGDDNTATGFVALISTQPEAITRPPVTMRSLLTKPAAATRPPVFLR